MSRVHIVVVAWNGAELLTSCVRSLFSQQSRVDHTIWIVDNASSDHTLETAKELAKTPVGSSPIHIVRSEYNRGYTGGANLGMRAVLDAGASDRDLVVVLNQDIEVLEGWLDALAEVNERVEQLGVVGCLAYYPDGKTIQHAGAYLEVPRLVAWHYNYRQQDYDGGFEEREVDFVTGAALGLRVEVLRCVGLFDEAFSPGYYEDSEICVRIRRQGWKVLFSPKARVKHAETKSFVDLRDRLVLSHRNRVLFALSFYEGNQIKAFFEAEAQYVQEQAHSSECQLLSSAYALALMRWTTLDQASKRKFHLDATRLRAILELRNLCIKRLSSYA
ncbi:MAG: glycosyltransferase family 2 protein [Thermoflexales bacterium]|nr:glycosyltransferase family 2 protein [Thermoflexales bacterium]MCS7325320.1 glycosyltransferase family 2 protein [Thermoflexales bacterium]